MACRNWSVSKVVRFLPMSGLYRLLAVMSSIFAVSIPFAVRAGRRSVPEQACRPVTCRSRVFVGVYSLYVYRTLAFYRVRGGFVDGRHRRQHKDPCRPTTLGGRRHVLPSSPPGLGQFVQGRFSRAGFLQPAATLLHLTGCHSPAF